LRQANNMVLVNFSEQNMHPTQAFADLAWRANPKLSPSAYRNVLGLTVSKVAVDCSKPAADIAADIQAGLNMLVLQPADAPRVAKALKLWGGDRAGLVLGLAMDVWDEPVFHKTIKDFDGLETVWLPKLNLAAAMVLEQAIKEGQLLTYGVRGTAHLPTALSLAEDAAKQVWGRVKRSGLRALMVPIGIGNMDAVLEPCITHKTEQVSAVEYAARMGWLVVANHVRYVFFSQQTLDAAAKPIKPARQAMALMHRLAEAEQAAQKKWPHRGGSPVFAITPFLLEGELPWPHLPAANLWRTQIWPQLQKDLAVHPDVLQAWQKLLPYIDTIAAVQAAKDTADLQISLCVNIKGWSDASALSILAGMVGSVPGVASVWETALSTPEALAVMTRPDVVDVGRYL
jgi:hypothetical protein